MRRHAAPDPLPTVEDRDGASPPPFLPYGLGPVLIPGGHGKAFFKGVAVVPVSGKNAVAVELGIAQIEQRAEQLPRLFSHDGTLFRGVGIRGGLLGQFLEFRQDIAGLGGHHVVGQLQPALGGFHIGLVLIRILNLVPGGQHPEGAGRVVRRTVDALLR